MNSLDHPLRRSMLKVLESWAMMLIEEVNDPAAVQFNPGERVYLSVVEVRGALDGTVSIVAQESFLKAVASNVLGVSDPSELKDEDWHDAFKEMGNVLAGNFLTEAYGESVTFDLFNPRVVELPFSELASFLSRNVVFLFTGDDIPVAVSFSIVK